MGLLDWFLGDGQHTDEERNNVRMALLSASAGLLANANRPTAQGLGAGMAAGLGGYNESQQTARRNKLTDAETAYKALNTRHLEQQIAAADQSMARRNAFAGMLTGQPSAPQAPQPGLPQIQPGALAGITPPQPAPQQAPQQQGGDFVSKLLDMGIPEQALQMAAQSDNPQAAVAALIKEYSTPHFGQGKIPLMPARGGGFRAAPVAGYNDALTAQVTAEKSAENPFQIVEGQDAQGRPVKGYAPQLFGPPPVPNAQPQGNGNVSIRGNMTQAQLAEIAKEMSGQPSAFRPVQQGGPLVGADPIEQARLKGGVETQTTQNTDIAKGFASDYVKAVQSEAQAPSNIAKYNQMKMYLSNVETGKAAKTVQGLKAYASYFAPDLAKSWTQETPYAQAAESLSNEMALQLRNPTGGAGMPGSMSDADRTFLVSMTANIGNDPRAIPMILDARIALEKRAQEVGKLAREYRKKNNGVMDEGFYQELQDFANSHPMFPQAQAAQPASGAYSFTDLDAEAKRRGLVK